VSDVQTGSSRVRGWPSPTTSPGWSRSWSANTKANEPPPSAAPSTVTPPTACPGSRRHAGPAPASSRRGRTAPPPPRIQEGLAWLAHLYSIQPHGRRLPTIDLDLEGAIRRGGSHQTSDVPLAVMAAPQVDHPTCQRCGFARSHVREVTRLHPYTDQEVRVRWCVDCRGEQRSTLEPAGRLLGAAPRLAKGSLLGRRRRGRGRT
jgi:hypothetical protein